MSKQSKKNSIRIIGGDWRGRRLPVLDLLGLRPSTDRVRETLFNWLMHDIHSSSCLDLFAGSGALGFESLSRGAKFVQLVELNRDATETLRKNMALFKVNANNTRAELDNQDAIKFLGRPASTSFDIVFLDPPFQSDMIESAAELLETNCWLKGDATIYIECDSRKSLQGLPANWLQRKQGRVGQSAFYLFQRHAK